jgi:anti-sigma factor RsiW
MNCDDFQQRIQAEFNGDPPGADGVEVHLATCPACRALDAAARRLRVGLLATPAPAPPSGLADRIVAGVLADRRQRQRSRRRLVFAGLGLAAAASLAIVLMLPKWMPNDSVAALPTNKEVVPEEDPVRKPSVPPPSLNENMAEATSAVASLARRTADQTVSSGHIFMPTVSLEVPAEELLAQPLEPPAQSLREAGSGVATGLGPVTNSARRAFDLFLRDIPPVASEPKSGL